MGGVRSRKYCASISDMTTTWGYVERWFSALIYPEHQQRPGECYDTYQVTVHVAGYVIGGSRAKSAEK